MALSGLYMNPANAPAAAAAPAPAPAGFAGAAAAAGGAAGPAAAAAASGPAAQSSPASPSKVTVYMSGDVVAVCAALPDDWPADRALTSEVSGLVVRLELPSPAAEARMAQAAARPNRSLAVVMARVAVGRPAVTLVKAPATAVGAAGAAAAAAGGGAAAAVVTAKVPVIHPLRSYIVTREAISGNVTLRTVGEDGSVYKLAADPKTGLVAPAAVLKAVKKDFGIDM